MNFVYFLEEALAAFSSLSIRPSTKAHQTSLNCGTNDKAGLEQGIALRTRYSIQYHIIRLVIKRVDKIEELFFCRR